MLIEVWCFRLYSHFFSVTNVAYPMSLFLRDVLAFRTLRLLMDNAGFVIIFIC